jgi:hypothetical protein
VEAAQTAGRAGQAEIEIDQRSVKDTVVKWLNPKADNIPEA